MKLKLKFFVLLVLCLFAGQKFLCAQSVYGDAVKANVKMKYVYSLDEAFKLAKKENKLIFCNCFEDWALPCHGMNKKVFSNQEFADWMDEHFINFFIDLSTPEGQEFRTKYNIKFMAHYVILDAEGNLIHRIVGGSELLKFQEQVACALSPETSLVGMNRMYPEHVNDKEFLRKYAMVLKVANEEEKYKQVAEDYFRMLKPDEWSEEQNWPFFSEHVREKDTVAFDYLIAHKDDFVATVGIKNVDNAIAGVFMMPLYFAAMGEGELSKEDVLQIREKLEEGKVDEENEIYVLCNIAYLRLKGDFSEMMDLVAAKVPQLDVRVNYGIDLSLPKLINEGKDVREKILNYMNARIETLEENVAMEYKSLLLEAGLEGGIVFEDLTLKEALDKAKNEQKYVFLDCYTSWCGPCKIMSKQVFVQKEVGDLFNPSCVNIKIDMEKGEGPEIAKKYGIQAYPTMLILYPDGQIKYRMQGGTEAGHFIQIARYALDPAVSYTQMKLYRSLSSCPLEKQADYLMILSDAGELKNLRADIVDYLKRVEGKKELYPDVWRLCGHFADSYEHPVFQFVLKNWKDFSGIDQKSLENKAERLIFPLYINYLAGKMSAADFSKLQKTLKKVSFPSDYSLVYLDRIVTYYQQKKWNVLMKCYTKEIKALSDAKLRLNLDILLRYFVKDAPKEVKGQMITYVQQCMEVADSRAINGYKSLMEALQNVEKD